MSRQLQKKRKRSNGNVYFSHAKNMEVNKTSTKKSARIEDAKKG